MSRTKDIIDTWNNLQAAGRLPVAFSPSGKLVEHTVRCITSSEQSSVWGLLIRNGRDGKPMDVYLKIFLDNEHANQVELQMYRRAYSLLGDFMPDVFGIIEQADGHATWILLECVDTLPERFEVTPRLFQMIIPTVAAFHARTFQYSFYFHLDKFVPWLPIEETEKAMQSRLNEMARTRRHLDQAMSLPHLKGIIAPFYEKTCSILDKGPLLFPELLEEGNSIIHNDLHMGNIGISHRGAGADPHIIMIDWEGAEYASVWFDLTKLVDVLLDFREDWQRHADLIRRSCVKLYAEEMQKHGIRFRTDPLKLYKMAYVQRALEHWLNYELYVELTGRPYHTFLIPGYLHKITAWGKELGAL